VSRNFWKSLAAVVMGNVLYNLSLLALPPAARHTPGRLDLGLLIDFWFCLVVLGLLELWYRRRRRARPPP
jgi:hypothetical protein